MKEPSKMREFSQYVEKSGSAIVKDPIVCLQLNLGYACNLHCSHCHLEAGPHRKELMSRQVIDDCLAFVERAAVRVVDITGGAPELNPNLRHLIQGARRVASVQRIILRSNLTLFGEDGFAGLPAFLAQHDVEIVASLPCYLESNVTAQRGDGVYPKSIQALRGLNQLGYGAAGPLLNLVYNPGGNFLPGPQPQLEAAYKDELAQRFGITFDSLYTITNMPIGRFRGDLESQGELEAYQKLLADNFNSDNLAKVMCRNLINVDWQGQVYDCDFNHVLQLPIDAADGYIGNLAADDLTGASVKLGQHCFACTAGTGSSCQGSLSS
jgi:radical SAM/Cys-rich protein